jgi:hypothetical protein
LASPKPATAVVFTRQAEMIEISVDGGELQVQTNPVILDQLEPGVEHTLEVSAEGFKKATHSFTPAEDALEAVVLGLEPIKVDSGLTIDAVPTGAEVLIDGEKVGVVPFTTTTLEPGKHTLRIVSGFEYAPYEAPVEVTKGEVSELPKVELVKRSRRETIRAQRAAKAAARRAAAE